MIRQSEGRTTMVWSMSVPLMWEDLPANMQRLPREEHGP